MNNKTLKTALISLCLVTAGAAFAQDRNDRNDKRDDRGPQHAEQSKGNKSHDDGYKDQGRNNDRHDNRGNQGRNDRDNYQVRNDHNNGPRGAGPRHDLRKGQRLDKEYRDRQYVVDDWRGHHLSAPPRGQHWVQTGGDYVLVGIATGIIASIILNN